MALNMAAKIYKVQQDFKVVLTSYLGQTELVSKVQLPHPQGNKDLRE